MPGLLLLPVSTSLLGWIGPALVLLFVGTVVLLNLRAGRGARLRGRLAAAARRGDAPEIEATLARVPPAERGRLLAGAALLLLEPPRSPDPLEALDEGLEEQDGGPTGEEGPPGPERALALDLARRALACAGEDGAARLDAARALAGAGALEELQALLGDSLELAGQGPAVLGGLGWLALEHELAAEAEALFSRALRTRPRDLDLVRGRAEALLGLDRPAEAAPLLEGALALLRGRMDALEWAGADARQTVDALFALHEDAVRRTDCAEKAIDALVANRHLDPRAGVNYRLLGHSLLVDSRAPARRLHVPSQAELEAALASAGTASGPARQEDEGLWQLRRDDLDRAEAAFRRAIEAAPEHWPALIGLGTVLDARRRSLRRWLEEAAAPPAIPALERLVVPWEALTATERRAVALALQPVAAAVPTLVACGGALHVVGLDGRCTDLDVFAGARGVLVEDAADRRTHDAIEGMALGPVAAVRIDVLHTIGDEDWCVAHELGHALHAILPAPLRREIEDLHGQAVEVGWTANDYALRNEFEFFACAYERFALRQAHPRAPRSELDEADVATGVDAFLRRLSATVAGHEFRVGALLAAVRRRLRRLSPRTRRLLRRRPRRRQGPRTESGRGSA